MSTDNYAVLSSILQHLQDSKDVREVKIQKGIDQETLVQLRKVLQYLPSCNSFCITQSDDKEITILRADRAGLPTCSFGTERCLRKSKMVLNALKTRAGRTSYDGCIFEPSLVNFDFWLSRAEGGDVQKCVPPANVCEWAASMWYSTKLFLEYREQLESWMSHTSSLAFVFGDMVDINVGVGIANYILDCSHRKGVSCRAIYVVESEVEVVPAAQISSVACHERLGNTVGYRLFINSKISDMSNMLFCSAQTLLLSLITEAGQRKLAELTHLIVDGVNRRSAQMDFLLSLLKEMLPEYPNLKLMLLSSSGEVTSLIDFFSHPTLVPISMELGIKMDPPSGAYSVQHKYLDTVLVSISRNAIIRDMKRKLYLSANPLKTVAKLQTRYVRLNENARKLLDSFLRYCWFSEDPNSFTLFLLVLAHNTHMVDYQHSKSRMTALMIAAAKGYVSVVRELLTMGANPCIIGQADMTAMDWCLNGDSNPCWKLIYSAVEHAGNMPRETFLCLLYHRLRNPYIVDQELVLDTVTHICMNYEPGKILVVLPDFPDILQLYGLLRRMPIYQTKNLTTTIYHRLTTEEELKEESGPCEANSFQVILISGSLLDMLPSRSTIDYVVDTGLKMHPCGDFAKGLCLDQSCLASAETCRSLGWLARKRTFFLYEHSDIQYRGKTCLPDPNVAGHPDAVLQALLCRPESTRVLVEEFFKRSLTVVSPSRIRLSLEVLEQVGAIESTTNVPTNLARLLANLNIGVHLGKTLLYSVLFRCMDPVITIVASLKMGSPFVDPLDSQEMSEIAATKVLYHNRSYSDCLVLLRLYQLWSQCKLVQTEQEMVQKNHLKVGFMEAISNTRVELMSVLRAIGIVKCGRTKNNDLLNENSKQWSLVKACLTAGLYPKLAMVDYSRHLLTSCCGTELLDLDLDPMSVVKLDNMSTKWVLYAEKRSLPAYFTQHPHPYDIPREQILENTVISDWNVLLLCGIDRKESYESKDVDSGDQTVPNDQETVEFIVDKRYAFMLSHEQHRIVRSLRRQLGLLFLRFIDHPHETIEDEQGQKLVAHIGEILEIEDTSLMIGNVSAIDARPKVKATLPMGSLWNYEFLLTESNETRTNPRHYRK